MEILAVVCLAIVWACFLIPPMLRKHREGRPGSSVHSFRRQLSTLERATPGTSLRPPASHRPAPLAGPTLGGPALAAPRTRSDLVRRRQQVLLALLGATGFTFLLVLALGGALAIVLFLASAGSLGAYVYALVQRRQRALEAAAKVRVLRPQAAPRAAASAPALSVRRTAAN